MGMMQAPIAALDDPYAIVSKARVQTAERIGWPDSVRTLPAFARFPDRARGACLESLAAHALVLRGPR
jgi:hypothetical protein